MKFIEWCGFFKIGHSLIDEQHQELFNIINQFHSDLSSNKPKKVAVCTLTNLIQFAQKHFSDEENVSKQFGFPEDSLSKHKNIHEKLIMDIFDLHNDISTDVVSDLGKIGDFLTEWIILHVLIEDNKYKKYLST